MIPHLFYSRGGCKATSLLLRGYPNGCRLWWHAFDGDELGREVESVELGGGVEGDFGLGTIGF